MSPQYAGRLIHWRGTRHGICARKDSGFDRRKTTQGNGVEIIDTAEATWPGNITCPICKVNERDTWAMSEAERESRIAKSRATP